MSSMTAERALKTLGENLRLARLKREMSVDDMAERMGVNRKTLMKLESGSGGVSIGALAMAMTVLGEAHRLEALVDPGTDGTGLLADRTTYRRAPRRRRPTGEPKGDAAPVARAPDAGDDAGNDDEYGIGF